PLLSQTPMPIICGTDLTTASDGALDVARALAAQRGDDHLTLVHVAEPTGAPAAREEAMEKARRRLEAVAASRSGGPSVRTELLTGEPDKALLSFAETEDCNLIVIAARSQHGSIMRLGTTAAKIVTNAQVPVLCVRDAAP